MAPQNGVNGAIWHHMAPYGTIGSTIWAIGHFMAPQTVCGTIECHTFMALIKKFHMVPQNGANGAMIGAILWHQWCTMSPCGAIVNL